MTDFNSRAMQLAHELDEADRIVSATSTPGMPFDIEKAAALLRALGNPVRLQIVLMLMNEDLDVNTIATRIGLGQSPTSQHLRILRDGQFVITTRSAQRVLYAVQDPAVVRFVETAVQTVDSAAGHRPFHS